MGTVKNPSPPQAETLGLDREAVARKLFGYNAYIEQLWIPDPDAPYEGAVKWNDAAALKIADAILAAAAVSQPPTSRQGAGEVEARQLYFSTDARQKLRERLSSLTPFEIGVLIDDCNSLEAKVLPAQPGPAPVDPQT